MLTYTGTRAVLCGLGMIAGLSVAGCSEHSGTPNDIRKGTPEAGPSGPTPAGDAGPDGGVPDDAGPDGGVPSDAGPNGDGSVPVVRDALFELTGLDDFASLAAAGSEVKYLLEANAAELPQTFPAACVFQNTQTYPYHLQFLQSLPGFEQLSAERYEDWVLWRSTRALYGGVMKLFAAAAHPTTDELGVLAYTVYAAATAEERLTADEIIDVHQQLSACAGPLADFLVYMPQTPAELQAARSYADAFDKAGVAVASPAELSPSLQAEVYTAGESYGFLRYVAEGADFDDVGPRDVLLTEAAPNDLGLVAALITKNPQSGVSHLNLRLREKGIPSAAAPRVFDAQLLQQLSDKLVHVRATDSEVIVEPASPADAQAFWDKKREPLDAPAADLSVEGLVPLAELEHEHSNVYGTKAANLGEIIRVLPEQNTVRGLAIPFAAYVQHIEHHQLDASVQALAESDPWQSGTSVALSALRDKIRQAPIMPEWEQTLLDQVKSVWGEAGLTTRLRFRSSTNAEDLPGISGAGLYDSASGCLADDLDDDEDGPSACLSEAQRSYYEAELARRQGELEAHPEREHLHAIVEDLQDELSKEKSARRALRKVWASLWNRRAFEDRQYYGIDHRDVYMAVAVHPAFVGEQLEAVVVTNLEPESDAPYYRVESQAGEVGVVRPSDPDAVAEQLRFRRGPDDAPSDVTLITPSSLALDGESLWQGAMLDELAARLFQLHDAFAQHVYPEISPLQLDIEVDVTHDGRVVFKQARPY